MQINKISSSNYSCNIKQAPNFCATAHVPDRVVSKLGCDKSIFNTALSYFRTISDSVDTVLHVHVKNNGGLVFYTRHPRRSRQVTADLGKKFLDAIAVAKQHNLQ